MPIKTILIAGAGTMGRGIAQLCALHGYQVLLHDSDSAALDNGFTAVWEGIASLGVKGTLTAPEAQLALQRVTRLKRVSGCGADLVIEAIVEDLEIKQKFWRHIDSFFPLGTIFATNTSSLSIAALAAATKRPDRFIGLHFFNPVHRMQLVEIIPGLNTSGATIEAARAFVTTLEKQITMSSDMPGFVTSRMVALIINEAFYMLMERVGSPEDIDSGITLGLNHPMGPLELGDLIGLDVVLAIMHRLHNGFGDDKYRPCPLLASYVEAGRLGRKSGQGVYTYPPKS